ncbi:hypothetical protein [Actinotalea ferrariae]|nr:hypothetical protein [Actinotalea ferrariae]
MPLFTVGRGDGLGGQGDAVALPGLQMVGSDGPGCVGDVCAVPGPAGPPD